MPSVKEPVAKKPQTPLKATLPLANSRPPRRSQEARSSESRHRLCESTSILLSEVGYERLTTALIAQHAQVSKGALAHHFPSKDDLLVATFRFMLNRWQIRREEFLKLHGQSANLHELMKYLWRDIYGRSDYVASLEIMLAARHYPELRTRLQAELSTWTGQRDKMLMEALPIDVNSKNLPTFLHLNFCFFRGLAMFRILEDEKHIEKILEMWTSMTQQFLTQSKSK